MPIALGEDAARVHVRQIDIVEKTPPAVMAHWWEYKASGSLTARNRLVRHYMATHVRPIAVRVRSGLPQQVDVDDLMQQGYLGLIDAMDRFDIDRDTRFETFSRRRIFGAIHQTFRTPTVSILVYAFLVWFLAVQGSLIQNLSLSAVSRLSTYGLACAAVPMLRRLDRLGRAPGSPALFRIPWATTLATLGVLFSLVLATRMNAREALLLGLTVLIALAHWAAVRRRPAPPI